MLPNKSNSWNLKRNFDANVTLYHRVTRSNIRHVIVRINTHEADAVMYSSPGEITRSLHVLQSH